MRPLLDLAPQESRDLFGREAGHDLRGEPHQPMELELDFVRVVRDGREDLLVAAVVFVGFALREGRGGRCDGDDVGNVRKEGQGLYVRKRKLVVSVSIVGTMSGKRGAMMRTDLNVHLRVVPP